MGWSRLEDMQIWNAVREIMSGPGRVYHDFSHVTDMYADAANLGIAWDEALDHAILCHDVIIDGRHPEMSSAHWLAAWRASDFQPALPEAEALIMTTATHLPGPDNRLVILDLAGLVEDDRRRRGSERVIAERLARDPAARWDKVVQGSHDYLQGLVARLRGGNPPEADREILGRIADGALKGSLALAAMLREKRDPGCSSDDLVP